MGALCDLEEVIIRAPHVVKGRALSREFLEKEFCHILQKRPGGARQSYPGAHVSDSLARRGEIEFVFQQQ